MRKIGIRFVVPKDMHSEDYSRAYEHMFECSVMDTAKEHIIPMIKSLVQKDYDGIVNDDLCVKIEKDVYRVDFYVMTDFNLSNAITMMTLLRDEINSIQDEVKRFVLLSKLNDFMESLYEKS